MQHGCSQEKADPRSDGYEAKIHSKSEFKQILQLDAHTRVFCREDDYNMHWLYAHITKLSFYAK